MLKSTIIEKGYPADVMPLGQVTVLGVEVGPTSVTVNGHVLTQGYTYTNKVG